MIANDQTLKAARAHLQTSDSLLAQVIAEAPLPDIVPHKNYYQKLVESIISQQLSVKAAATILRRFIELFDDENFPAPDQILAKTVDELRSVGLSRQKISYIQDIARRVIDGSVQFNHLDALSNEAIVSELTKIKGVGEWTVHMFLIFCMGRLDVLPTGDLGIKNAARTVYGLSEKPTAEVLQKIAIDQCWHPYESVASWYLWYSLDNKPS